MRHSVSNAIQDAPDILRSGEGAILAPDFDDLLAELASQFIGAKRNPHDPSNLQFWLESTQ